MSLRHVVVTFGLCATVLFAAEKKETPTFAVISKMVPGQITREELSKRFGKPDEIIDFAKLPDSKSQTVEWAYKKDDYNRVTFTFEGASDSVDSWQWTVHEREPLKSLEAAKKVFPNAKWQAQTEKWINPHAFPAVCFFKDEKLGVSLEFNLVRREVDEIARWNPDRKPASSQDDKRPTFCIDKACSPAIPASEFFKDNSVEEYCQKVH